MCKYCNGDGVNIIEDNILDGEGMKISLYAGVGELVIDAEWDSGCCKEFITMNLNYCPHCGRRF